MPAEEKQLLQWATAVNTDADATQNYQITIPIGYEMSRGFNNGQRIGEEINLKEYNIHMAFHSDDQGTDTVNSIQWRVIWFWDTQSEPGRNVNSWAAEMAGFHDPPNPNTPSYLLRPTFITPLPDSPTTPVRCMLAAYQSDTTRCKILDDRIIDLNSNDGDTGHVYAITYSFPMGGHIQRWRTTNNPAEINTVNGVLGVAMIPIYNNSNANRAQWFVHINAELLYCDQ